MRKSRVMVEEGGALQFVCWCGSVPVCSCVCVLVCQCVRVSVRKDDSLWALWCAGFRHSAGLHARVILDGGVCRLRELGDVRNVLGVLGDALVVPIGLRVLVSYKEE